MQEVKIEKNESGLKVYINGNPNVKNIPKETWESFISVLELQLTESYNSQETK